MVQLIFENIRVIISTLYFDCIFSLFQDYKGVPQPIKKKKKNTLSIKKSPIFYFFVFKKEKKNGKQKCIFLSAF